MQENNIDTLKLRKDLENSGWQEEFIGEHRSNGKNVSIKGFVCYIRETKIDDFLKKSSSDGPKNPAKSMVSAGVAKNTMTRQQSVSPPSSNVPVSMIESASCGLTEIGNLSSVPSVANVRSEKRSLVIGYDSEWENLLNGGRSMLSYQFSYVWNGRLIEICFIRTGEKLLSIKIALGFILDYIGFKSVDERSVRRYEYCYDWDNDKPLTRICDSHKEAMTGAVYAYRYKRDDGSLFRNYTHEKISDMPDAKEKHILGGGHRTWSWFHSFLDLSGISRIPITLVCHAGKGDISGMNDRDLLYIHLSEVQGGLISLQPFVMEPKSLKKVSNARIYPVSISIADTMCHAPAGNKSLASLGQSIHVEKVELPDGQKEHMLTLLENDPALFLEYAASDSTITMLYHSSIYGYNRASFATLTSAAATMLKRKLMTYLDAPSLKEFNAKFRGLEKVSHGLTENSYGKSEFLEASSLEPVSHHAHSVQEFCSQAFRGGYNACIEVGYFPRPTYDYDLIAAYATSMCLVPDIDWQDPISFHIINEKLDKKHFKSAGPLTMFVGYVKFRFPDDVKFPCIPIPTDGVPVYPKSSDNIDGVYAAGPFVYLALMLGAEIFCEEGFFLNTLDRPDGSTSRSLAYGVKAMVKDRMDAKEKYGAKSLEEQTLKQMINALYGKIAQNVISKHTWSSYSKEMEDLGCSAITNPVSAMMITSLIQGTLIAAQNQLTELGYICCSVTTDGFISDCPKEILDALDLLGFAAPLHASRLYLTDNHSDALWEVKHTQDDLINFDTRGNISLSEHGVCAHDSTVSGFTKNSYEDRLWLMKAVLSRTDRVTYTVYEWSKFKDMVSKGLDFSVTAKTKHKSLDFDLKRKPVRDSFRTDHPIVNGTQYEIAHFDTEPYDSIKEFQLYREKAKRCVCLRTEKDWKIFFNRIDTAGSGMHANDMEWNILMSVVRGHKMGLWTIPKLSYGSDLSLDEKISWINTHNNSKRKFTQTSWKDCGRLSRQGQMLERHLLQDKIEEMTLDIRTIDVNDIKD